MKAQAQQLVEAVAVFKLSGSTNSATSKSVASVVERREPQRATKVVRPTFAKPPSQSAGPRSFGGGPVAATGTDDWESF